MENNNQIIEKEPQKEIKKINVRQQLYKKYRLEGFSKFASAIKAGYSRNTAINAGKNIENRCNFEELLEIEGITDNYLALHTKQGLEAKKPIACDVMIKNENGELKVNKNSNDWIEYEDWHVRHRYYETVLKLTNRLKDSPLVDQSKHTYLTKIENKPIIIFEGVKDNANGSLSENRIS